MSTHARAHRTPRRLLTVLLAASLACSGDSVAGNSLDAAGHWTLKSYSGAPLPAVAVNKPTAKVEITGGDLDLRTDGAYGIVTTYRLTQGGVVSNTTDPSAGNWVARGGQVTLSTGNGVADGVATYTPTTLTLYSYSESGALVTFDYVR